MDIGHVRKGFAPWPKSRLRLSCVLVSPSRCTSGSPPRRPRCGIRASASRPSPGTSASTTTRPRRRCAGSSSVDLGAVSRGPRCGCRTLRLAIGDPDPWRFARVRLRRRDRRPGPRRAKRGLGTDPVVSDRAIRKSTAVASCADACGDAWTKKSPATVTITSFLIGLL